MEKVFLSHLRELHKSDRESFYGIANDLYLKSFALKTKLELKLFNAVACELAKNELRDFYAMLGELKANEHILTDEYESTDCILLSLRDLSTSTPAKAKEEFNLNCHLFRGLNEQIDNLSDCNISEFDNLSTLKSIDLFLFEFYKSDFFMTNVNPILLQGRLDGELPEKKTLLEKLLKI